MRSPWRFLATDLEGGLLLELPLASPSWSDSITGDGELSGELDLDLTTATGLALGPALLAATTPRRTRVFVERGDELVWGGLVWSRPKRRGQARRLQLRAISTLTWLRGLHLTTAKAYVAVDQFTAVRDLVTWAQSQPGANLGITTDTALSGVDITRTPLAWAHELRSLGDLFDELAAGDDGFDLSLVAHRPFGIPVEALQLDHPWRGRSAGVSGLVFRSGPGGNVIDYDVDENANEAATDVYATGAGDGASMLIAEASAPDLIAAGYLRTDTVAAWRTIDDPTALQRVALEELRATAGTPLAWTLEVDPRHPTVPFGAYGLGDHVHLVIDPDWRFPDGWDGIVRIVGWHVQISDDGGPETVIITTGPSRE